MGERHREVYYQEDCKLGEEECRKGYLLKVDVEYPTELHDTHNDLPFMPEKMEINKVEKLYQISATRKNMCYIFENSIKI